jgi:hypothetical protein
MSRENVDLVRRGYDMFAERDLDGIAAEAVAAAGG